MYKGKRVQDGEYFDDIIQNGGVGGRGNAGILASAGLDDYDSVSESVQQDGILIELNCRYCNSKRGIVLEWPEIYQVGANMPGMPPLMPQGWRYSPNNGTAVFIHRCPSCSHPEGLAIHMTPDEGRRHVTSAVDAGIIPKQAIAAWGQHVAKLRGQFRG